MPGPETGLRPAAPVRYERRGAVAVLTLNRPHRMNAVDAATATALGTLLDRADGDDGVRAIVVTGSGRAFCAGADLRELAAGRSVRAAGHEEWGFAGLTRHRVDTPLIAAVNGFAVGGGTEIVLACDMAVASTTATFQLPEVARGLIPAEGGLVRAPRRLPATFAAELALTGRPVDAATALARGLVNAVVPPERVLDAALDLAGRVAANAPLAVRAAKRMLSLARRSADGAGPLGESELWAANDAAARAVFASADAREGKAAFVEKRPPKWRGR